MPVEKAIGLMFSFMATIAALGVGIWIRSLGTGIRTVSSDVKELVKTNAAMSTDFAEFRGHVKASLNAHANRLESIEQRCDEHTQQVVHIRNAYQQRGNCGKVNEV